MHQLTIRLDQHHRCGAVQQSESAALGEMIREDKVDKFYMTIVWASRKRNRRRQAYQDQNTNIVKILRMQVTAEVREDRRLSQDLRKR